MRKKRNIELIDRANELMDRLAKAIVSEKNDGLSYHVIVFAMAKFTAQYLMAFKDFTKDYSTFKDFFNNVEDYMRIGYKDDVYHAIWDKFEEYRRFDESDEEEEN